MKEYTVRVTSLEQWVGVLDWAFENGYSWKTGVGGCYKENRFHSNNASGNGGVILNLKKGVIGAWASFSSSTYAITYDEFKKLTSPVPKEAIMVAVGTKYAWRAVVDWAYAHGYKWECTEHLGYKLQLFDLHAKYLEGKPVLCLKENGDIKLGNTDFKNDVRFLSFMEFSHKYLDKDTKSTTPVPTGEVEDYIAVGMPYVKKYLGKGYVLYGLPFPKNGDANQVVVKYREV